MSPYLASLNGTIAAPEQTTLPVTDEGLLRGDGAFEVIRLYNGRPFALADHLTRLQASCAGLKLTADFDRLEAEIDRLLERTGAVEAMLRIVITRGERRIAIVEPLPPEKATIRVFSVEYAVNPLLTGLKTLSYAGNMLAVRLAHENGFDDALFVSPDRQVLEGPTWSFFWAQDGTLYTPPTEAGILSSITRSRLIEELPVVVKTCAYGDLGAIDEAFLASTVREVLPITAIDDIVIASAPGSVTRNAQSALRSRIERELSTATVSAS